MAAQSQTDVCNGALQLLGLPVLASINDNSPAARACAVSWDCTRRDEIRKHKWNFAIKRVSLAPDATAPAFDFTYQYSLPSDCIRVLLNEQDDSLDWVVEGRKILTNNYNPLNLRYIADITDCTQWDPAFYQVMQISLAQAMCEQLTNSTSKKQVLDREYDVAQAEAKRNNSFETISIDAPDDDWWLVRDGGSRPAPADVTVNFIIGN